jgi:uncharacterized protein (DUF1501 family)
MSAPTLTRRVLLKGGACALLAGALPPRFLTRAAVAADARKKVLVAVFQRGAVDGLSMVVPHGDGAYSALRTATALRPPRRGDGASAVDLDGFFALHPSLAPLTPLWQSRALAVVHACALRRAGLHGVRDAGRQIYARRLARAGGARPACARLTVTRGGGGAHGPAEPAR